MFLVLCLVTISCDNSNLVNEAPTADQEISQIDKQPILTMKASEFYQGNKLDEIRDKLASRHGSAIVRALNQKDNLQDGQVSPIVPLQKLNNFVRQKADMAEIGSSHIRIQEPNGESEDFVLTLRRYHQNATQMLHKGSSSLESSTTYLALSPDRFYLQDDENGNEQWPVTFPAVSLDDPSKEITVTFNADGFMYSSLGGNSQAKTAAGSGQPDLVFVEATPIITPQIVTDPCKDQIDCGGGGGGGGTGFFCSEVGGRGGATGGSTSGTQTYFTINNIRMYVTGDGDGASELQMFVKQDDNYDGECFPRSYKYRFDQVLRVGEGHTSVIQGANGVDYEVPDVNSEDVDYDEFYTIMYDSTGYERNEDVGKFPLIDLTHQPGPWRFVLVDDDKDYADFSRRRTSEPLKKDIWTFDMADGNWKLTATGLSADSHHYGSSDDAIPQTGVRRITKSNANERGGYQEFQATKSYSGGYFSYSFSLWDD